VSAASILHILTALGAAATAFEVVRGLILRQKVYEYTLQETALTTWVNDAQPRLACTHEDKVEVMTLETALAPSEQVAWWCPGCSSQLPLEVRTG
jgi:hypothetical protein